MQKVIPDHMKESKCVSWSAQGKWDICKSPPIKAKSPLQKSGQKDYERPRSGEQYETVSSEHDEIAILINWNQL